MSQSMVYYLGNHAPSGRATIDMFDSEQLAWWSRVFAVTPAELWQAVRTVGNMPEDIRTYLRHLYDGLKHYLSLTIARWPALAWRARVDLHHR